MSRRSTISPENQKYSYRPRGLPHLFSELHPVFLTYRFKFSLPQTLRDSLNRRKTEWQQELLGTNDAEKALAMHSKDALFFSWYDELLAKSSEVPQILHRDDITKIISSAFHCFDKQRYHLLAYCIMPNHVHVLFIPAKQYSGEIYPPAHIAYSWKRWTSNQINRLLERKGSLWQQESYDHLVRDEEELLHTVNYIKLNPVKAGLVESWEQWQGTWIREDYRK